MASEIGGTLGTGGAAKEIDGAGTDPSSGEGSSPPIHGGGNVLVKGLFGGGLLFEVPPISRVCH